LARRGKVLAADVADAVAVRADSGDTDPRRLLAEAIAYLKSYRTMLLESRSGAASDNEQYALGLSFLIERAEAALGRRGDQIN
jgi:hypothetical protein